MSQEMLGINRNSKCWHKRAPLERCLAIVSAFVSVALIGSANAFPFEDTGIASVKSSTLNLNTCGACSYDLCLTAECLQTDSTVLSKMDTDINPCNNFYQFACPKFINYTQISEDKSFVDLFSQTKDKSSEEIKAIITEERPETEPKHLKLPYLLFQACMNTSLIESRGIAPINEISDSLGRWPVIVGNSWNSNETWSWEETIKKLRWYGFGTYYLLHFGFGKDVKNNTKQIITLDQPGIGLNREYLVKGLNESFVSAYYEYMVDIAVIFGAEKQAAEEELMEVLQFEMDLANISLPEDKRLNHSDLCNFRTIKQLQETYTYMNWLGYINGVLPEGVDVNENEVVILLVPGFFNDLGKLLQRTKKRVIANYLLWRTHSQWLCFLTEKLRERQTKCFGSLVGIQERDPRWKECVAAAERRHSIALGSLCVRNQFKGDSKNITLEIVNEMLDDDELQEFDSEKYFEPHMNIEATSTTTSFRKLRMPVKKVLNRRYIPRLG